MNGQKAKTIVSFRISSPIPIHWTPTREKLLANSLATL